MTAPNTTTEHSARPQATEIAGTLHEPLVRRLSTGDGEQITYHWGTEDNRHTYVHLTLRRHPNQPVELATTNVDSEDVKGQGNALWTFVGDTLQARSDERGVGIIHEVHPNDYSRRLPEADPRYITLDEGQTFLGLYVPRPPEQAGHAAPHALGVLSVPQPGGHS